MPPPRAHLTVRLALGDRGERRLRRGHRHLAQPLDDDGAAVPVLPHLRTTVCPATRLRTAPEPAAVLLVAPLAREPQGEARADHARRGLAREAQLSSLERHVAF